MRARTIVLLLLLCMIAAPAAHAGLISLGVGVYGGMSMPVELDANVGSIVGARVKVLTPIPSLGVEAYYASVRNESVEDLWEEQDLGIVFDGNSYNSYGVNVLFGGLTAPGFRAFGVAGVNFVNFEEGSEEVLKYGGELGVGVEIVPPMIGLGIEGRASVMILGWDEGPDRKLATLSVGVNYYF